MPMPARKSGCQSDAVSTRLPYAGATSMRSSVVRRQIAIYTTCQDSSYSRLCLCVCVRGRRCRQQQHNKWHTHTAPLPRSHRYFVRVYTLAWQPSAIRLSRLHCSRGVKRASPRPHCQWQPDGGGRETGRQGESGT